MMEQAETTRYPVRYVAREHPGVMHINRERAEQEQAGEIAALYEPEVNEAFPHITDGLYIEIYRGIRGYIWDGTYTEPNRGRRQHRGGRRVATLEQALIEAERFLDSIHGFIASTNWARAGSLTVS